MPLSHFVTAYPSPSPYPQVHSLVGLCLYSRLAPRFFMTFFFFFLRFHIYVLAYCICIYIYRERARETETETERNKESWFFLYCGLDLFCISVNTLLLLIGNLSLDATS